MCVVILPQSFHATTQNPPNLSKVHKFLLNTPYFPWQGTVVLPVRLPGFVQVLLGKLGSPPVSGSALTSWGISSLIC